ncbi:hypothetical protein A3K73_05770 [Candidatus Pacearchaeota archaeon RBG_13_36_9]|nr:MAG: hypothetical protein A3K73_05770 [Candidatus Pacearchaeota archaeon RBG_13_36_9]
MGKEGYRGEQGWGEGTTKKKTPNTLKSLDYKSIFYYLSGLSFLILIIFMLLWLTGFLPIFFKDNFTYIFFIITAIITTYFTLAIKKIPEQGEERDKRQTERFIRIVLL